MEPRIVLTWVWGSLQLDIKLDGEFNESRGGMHRLSWPELPVFLSGDVVASPPVDELQIIIEEPSFLVISKPSGLFSQAARGIDSVQTLLHDRLASRPDAPLHPFIGLPHRLDRGTSGIMIVARHQRALKRLGDQFHSRIVRKTYLALLEGVLSQERGTWIDWMRKIPDRPVAEIVSPESAGARQAVMHFRMLATDRRTSLVALRLETGRMHQIRLQAAWRGHPVLGDWTYGSQATWGDRDAEGLRQNFALHARALAFRHPMTALAIEAKAPIPRLWSERYPHLAVAANLWPFLPNERDFDLPSATGN